MDHRDAHHLRKPPAAEVTRRIGFEVANRGHELQPRPTASGRHDRVRHGGHEFRSAVVNRCRQTNGAATTAASWRFQRCPVPLVLLPVPRRRRDAVASSARMDNARPATEVRRIRPAFHSGGWLSLRWRGDFSKSPLSQFRVHPPLIARSNQTNARGVSGLSRSSRLGHRSNQHGSARVIRPTR